MTERSSRYTVTAIALHWVIALVIIFMIWLGWNMEDMEGRLQLHKSIGITILLLTVARIVWRMMNRPPPLPADMPPLEKTASHLVHLGFYALMLAMPLTGWLAVSTNIEMDLPIVLYGAVSWPDMPGIGFLKNEAAYGLIEFIHSKLAWLTLGLLALHVIGALKHEFSAEEGVIKRMVPGLFGETASPLAPSRGFFTAFGLALGAFVVIAGIPLISSSIKAPPKVEAAGFSANWTIDYDASSIQFSGLHDGSTYSGGFGNWTADIQFDPDHLDRAKARVSVLTGSVTANQKLYSDSLKSTEWLNPETFPTATVNLDNMVKTGASYSANAAITLKDITLNYPLAFTLDIENDTARMSGSTQLQRKPLNLGQQSDPGGDWVGEDITIDIVVVATRIQP